MTETPSDMPYVEIGGTHYQVGYQFGQLYSAEMQRFHREHRSMNDSLIPFLDTKFGAQIYHEYHQACKKAFPEYVTELEGLADGAGVPFRNVFASNIVNELMPFSKDRQMSSCYPGSGCTNVHINCNDTFAIGHNEDGDADLSGQNVVTSVTIFDETDAERLLPKEKFTTVAIVGYLFGICPGFNHSGLVFAANSLRPRKSMRRQLPKTFIYRAILRAQNIHEVVGILEADDNGMSQGTCINVGSTALTSRPLTWNIEVICPENASSKSRVSVFEIQQGQVVDGRCSTAYIHCNRYTRIMVDEVEADCHVKSTARRNTRFVDFKPMHTIKDILNFLGDNKDEKFPVYRKWQESDKGFTSATILFDLLGAKMDIYVGNPKIRENLVYSFPIPRAQ